MVAVFAPASRSTAPTGAKGLSGRPSGAEASYGLSIVEPSSPGSVLSLIRSGEATTRNELAEQLGIARSTVVQRLGVLGAAGLVKQAGDAQSSGGRPASIFAFDENAGLVVVGDLGQT